MLQESHLQLNVYMTKLILLVGWLWYEADACCALTTSITASDDSNALVVFWK